MAIARSAQIAERTAQTFWTSRLSNGRGTVKSGSGAIGDLPVTWPARIRSPNGQTSPEELAAAAQASSFSMALALRLGEQDATPERIDVTATISLDEVDGQPTVVSSALSVRAWIPGLSETAFRQAVNEAADLFSISRLFAGASISIDATLDRSRGS